MWNYKATVTRVIDGDTIECMVDLGFKNYSKQRIRLQDVDAPEIRTLDTREKEHGLYVFRQLASHFAKVGMEIEIATDYQKTFDRYVAHVYDKDGNNISELVAGWIESFEGTNENHT